MGTGVTRQALYFTAPGKVEVRQETIPPPQGDQILVANRFSAISPGTETLIYRGQAPTELAADETLPSLSGDLNFPLKYGYAAVGEVIDGGPEALGAWEGRWVFSFQPHQSHFLAPQEDLLPIPKDLPLEEALFVPNMETAVNFLHDGAPLAGEQVAVFGQGIVGLLTTALLARLPLASLVTLDRYLVRRKASLSLGAHASLDPLGEDALPRLRAELQGHRPYPGADLTYELTGSPKALDQAIAATGFSGRVVIGSWYGRKRADLDLGGRFHRSRIQLISSQVSTIAPHLAGRWTKGRRLSFALEALGRIRPSRFITHRFPIEEASAAYELIDQSPEEVIQVVLVYDGVRDQGRRTGSPNRP